MFASKWSSTERLVAQEWIEDASRKTRVGRHCRCCPRLCYKRACVEALYLYCGTFGIIAFALFLALATGIVAPFHHSLHYVATRCTAVTLQLDEKLHHCLCSGRHCSSTYPCVKILVSYNTTEGVLEESQMHDTQYDSGECSYNPQCLRSETENARRVSDYVAAYGEMNVSFPCLYNPRDVQRVIRKREGHHVGMLHALLWPGLIVVVSGLGVLLPYLTCGCNFLWRRHPPQSIRQEALNRSRGIVLAEYMHMDGAAEQEA